MSAPAPAPGIVLGDVEIIRVIEWSGPVRTARFIVPDSDEETWRRNEDWLAPDFWTPADDAYRCHVQTFVLRSEGRTILVDTGIGNGRDRPQVPQFAHLRTDFLDRLRAAGVEPEDVDVVVNTHIHYDHVGWNTRWLDGQWVPTFPHATYLVPRADHRYFDPAGPGPGGGRAPRDDHERVRWEGSRLVFEDSIAPVERAGQLVLWEDRHRIDGNLLLEAAPGHTPGSSALTLRSGADRAVFVGDMLHSPVQVLEPEWNSCFCDDVRLAAKTRRAFLARAADLGELVVPAHWPGHSAAEIRPRGDGFAIKEWAAFPRA
ncbi:MULTISPECIES: MBL fold metallo-hydrolase [Streptomyces]|jgi:glyoxylase-like metal-dependent hydrolase (beta-lactamase superfamily II)|uniref:Glyoxylase-like metal-dependent hydrolase (Beta-lactamase superfamily II) n=1 Tax=Streptomyces thermodiastaticus TaxID=44061 RepID=A0ABU0KGI7_9ACTN|nr:MBL fold metallo-hydrolase [Streptomyces sp. McG7]MBT2904308.1 MBL fold metallo-hydrolase [Streptomyces sp. McG8]MDQ0488522.1 glyoxylase-like metal-dependent hydrolase (beta-lactamase superfamily II) [Streptomyces thermodiastaticus]MDX3415359.1 MBL fold metallo-hydrolase [Streptomyces sp. MD20-1-1]MXQ56342.1 MBL fold metallo-hydrolase [Streptomyces sp. XHT-2]MYW50053.1 MBL fold metallo-hydrolase [Streptomyces sp. SID8376]THC57791.1 MBL fold metallo-hydrolase [Streptomyces sp. Akac8]UVT093